MTCVDRSSIPSLCQPMITHVNRFAFLHLAHLNVCGLKSKEADIRCDKTLKHVDVMHFNETHLNTCDIVTPNMLEFDDAYSLFRQDRSDGGGILVLVHSDVRPRQILTTTDVEVVVLQLSLPDMHLYVMSVYRSPHYFAVNWTNEMSRLLSLYNDKRICVIGDVIDDVSSNASTPILDMFMGCYMTQQVTSPT